MRRIAMLSAVFTFVIASATTATALIGSFGPGDSPAAAHLPDNDHARGLVFDGLRAAADGPCAGGFAIEVNGQTLCTHGPDSGPPGLDVRSTRGLADLHRWAEESRRAGTAASETVFGTAAEAGIIPLIGDGVDGNRVQAIYAVAADRTDRYAEVAPLIAEWAAYVDTMTNASAGLTGGERHVRFVTDAAGNLDIDRVVLPITGDDTFGNTISALQAAGYTDGARKYLIWVDASLYCGIATIYNDDKPTQDNYNNGRFPMYARVDAGCWGFTTSVELHELVHNLGGVQQSAPHSTPGWHCTDEYDRMCYKDSSSVEMTYVCPAGMENSLDCGHDDYFHTSPPPGSYLDTHWNVADSSFLHAGSVDGEPPPPPPPPANQPPTVSVAGPASVTLPDGAFLDGTADDDGLPTATLTLTWTASGPGTVTFTDPTAEDTTATFPTPGTYQVTLTADDGEFTTSDSLTITIEPEPPENQAPSVSISGPSSITLPDGAALDGTVSDDGLPDGTLDLAWSASGPGTVTFADPAAADTTATFTTPGTYTLTLTADDGELNGSDGHTITVEEEPPSTVIDRASPVVTIVVPAAGGVYGQGTMVLADYSCTDDGSGIVSCDGPVGDGSPLDTATPGSFQFRVTGVDAAGNTTTATRSYEVVATCDGKPVTLFVPPGGALFEGTPGNDVILGTTGPDRISGRGGNDTICGLDGDDVLLGGTGDDTLVGGPGDDRLRGADGDDILRGDGGSDRLLPEAGDDVVDGGAGSDIVDYLAAAGPVTVDLGAATALYLPTTGGSWSHTLVLVEKVDGSPFDDTLIGDGRRNVLRGKHGADSISGGDGDDVLIGGLGDDRIQGGAGADLVKGQADDDILSGGAGDDRLVGGSGNDTLEGDAGDDTLIGGLKRHLGRFADLLDGGGGIDACRWYLPTVNCP